MKLTMDVGDEAVDEVEEETQNIQLKLGLVPQKPLLPPHNHHICTWNQPVSVLL
jgi:hypothetical protein